MPFFHPILSSYVFAVWTVQNSDSGFCTE